MKRVLKMQDLDCANCAAKMENAIKKIDGVNSVSISFMSQKMFLDVEDSKYDIVVKEIVKVCKKVDSDCEVLVKYLKDTKFPDAEVLGHRDLGAKKDCPCFDVREFLRCGSH